MLAAWDEERTSLLCALDKSEQALNFYRQRELKFREREAALTSRNAALRAVAQRTGNDTPCDDTQIKKFKVQIKSLQVCLERAEARASAAERALKLKDMEALSESRSLREKISLLEGRLTLLDSLKSSAVAAAIGISQDRPINGRSLIKKSPAKQAMCSKKSSHVIAPAGMRNTKFVLTPSTGVSEHLKKDETLYPLCSNPPPTTPSPPKSFLNRESTPSRSGSPSVPPPRPTFSIGTHSPEKLKTRLTEYMLSAMGFIESDVTQQKPGQSGTNLQCTSPPRTWGGMRVKDMSVQHITADTSMNNGKVECENSPNHKVGETGFPTLWASNRDNSETIKRYG